jgi:EmrB/QacA subfamily drug resistance transporter
MGGSDSRRWWALAGVTLAVLAAGIDGTVLSVALPTLATVLHASESDLQWFSAGYLMVVAAAMLPAGLLGDRYGRKRVMLVSLALFGLGSATCAAVKTPGEFVAARVLLGLAAAGIIVMAVSALTVLFTPEERPKAVGIWAAANFVSVPIGPVLGGWLLAHTWWGWVFLMNVPVAAVGLVAALLLVPESRSPDRPKLDPLGILASTAGLVGLTYGFIETGISGWGSARALLPAGLGLGLLLLFFLWEQWLGRRPGGQPLVDPALFRSASFTWGVVLMSVAVLAMIGVLFVMPQYFQGVLGTNAMGSGVRLLPLVGGLIVGALPADRVARRLGGKVTVSLGCAVLAGGLLLGGATDMGATDAFVAVWMAVAGAGMGLAMSTAASAALAELSEERSGVGSAVLQALKNVGGPIGSAVLGSVLNATYRNRLALGGLPAAAGHLARESVFAGVAVAGALRSQVLLASVRGAFVSGLDRVLWASSAVALCGALLALAFLPRAGSGKEGRVAQ